MSTQLNKKSVARNYAFLAVMLGSMVLGSIVGWIFPQELDADGNVISAGATRKAPQFPPLRHAASPQNRHTAATTAMRFPTGFSEKDQRLNSASVKPCFCASSCCMPSSSIET